MSILPEFQIGWLNGWWYPAVFGLINLVLIVVYGPRAFGRRLVRLPVFVSRMEKILSLAQERFCLETYGEFYREYMQRTPRYFA